LAWRCSCGDVANRIRPCPARPDHIRPGSAGTHPARPGPARPGWTTGTPPPRRRRRRRALVGGGAGGEERRGGRWEGWGGWGGDVAKSGRRAVSTASVAEAGSNSAAATQRSEGVFRAYACEEACLAGDLPSRGLPGDFSTLFARWPAFGDAAAAAAASRRLSGDLSAPCDCWLA
jgi:hypothetical protein